MEEPKILLGLDLSVASREVIEILIEDASEQDIFDEIARANKDRHEILEFLLRHPGIPEQVKSGSQMKRYLHMFRKTWRCTIKTGNSIMI